MVSAYGFYVISVTFYSLLEDGRDTGVLVFALIAAMLSVATVWPLATMLGEDNAALWGMLMIAVVFMFLIGGVYVYLSTKYRKALGAFVPFFLSPLCLLGGLGFVFLTARIEPVAGVMPSLVLAAFYPPLAGYAYYRAHRAAKTE